MLSFIKHSLPDASLSAWSMYVFSYNPHAIWDIYHYYPHFIVEQSEEQRVKQLVQGHAEGQSWASNPWV